MHGTCCSVQAPALFAPVRTYDYGQLKLPYRRTRIYLIKKGSIDDLKVIARSLAGDSGHVPNFLNRDWRGLLWPKLATKLYEGSGRFWKNKTDEPTCSKKQKDIGDGLNRFHGLAH